MESMIFSLTIDGILRRYHGHYIVIFTIYLRESDIISAINQYVLYFILNLLENGVTHYSTTTIMTKAMSSKAKHVIIYPWRQ
jgi:hypothetical protein